MMAPEGRSALIGQAARTGAEHSRPGQLLANAQVAAHAEVQAGAAAAAAQPRENT